jgi:hypothetical protein
MQKRAKVGLVAPLTDGERRYMDQLIATYGGRRSFPMKQCYKNAQRLMIADSERRLRYCEGYLDGSVPHAWVTINGKVVDLTGEALDRHLRRIRRAQDGEHSYFGSVIDRLTLARHIGHAKEQRTWSGSSSMRNSERRRVHTLS